MGSKASKKQTAKQSDQSKESLDKAKAVTPAAGAGEVSGDLGGELHGQLGSWGKVLALAVSVAALAAAAAGVAVVKEANRLNKFQNQLARGSITDVAKQANSDAKNHHVTLVSKDRSLTADAVITESGQGFLLSSDLPQTDATSTYQLWAAVGGQEVSLGLTGRNGSWSAFVLPSGATSLGITKEGAAGAVALTRPALVEAELTAGTSP